MGEGRNGRLTMKLLSVEEIFICCANWGAHAEYAYCHTDQTLAKHPTSYWT